MSMSCPSCGRIVTRREIEQGRAVTVPEGLLCPECGEKHVQRMKSSAPAAKQASSAKQTASAGAKVAAAAPAASRPAAAGSRPAAAATARAAAPAVGKPRPAPRAAEPDDEDDEGPGRGRRSGVHHVHPREREDKVMKYAMIGGVILFVIAGVAGGLAYSRMTSKREREEREFNAVKQAKAEIVAFKEQHPDDPNGLEALAKKNLEEMKDFNNKDGVRPMTAAIAEAVELRDRQTAQGAAKSALDAAEKELQGGGDPRAVLTKIETDVQPLAAQIGPEFKARMDTAVKSATNLAVTRVKDETLKFAEDNKAKPTEVFAKLNASEEELRKLQLRGADGKSIAEALKEIVERGDAIAEAAFTPDKVEQIPWRDLLATADASKWGKGGTVNFKIENHVLTIEGPPADSKDQGIVGIAEDEGIRDFILECKLTVVKGSGFIMMFRKEPTGQRTAQYGFKTEGLKSIPSGEPITIKIEAHGSKGTIDAEPSHGITGEAFRLGVDKARKGGFGFSCEAETTIAISDIKIKVIR